MINKISNDTIAAMKRKSALPDRPTAQGYKPEQIKKALTGMVVDDKNSVIAEINRIVDELNTRGFVSGSVKCTISTARKGEPGTITVTDNGTNGVNIDVVCPYGTDGEEVQRLIDLSIEDRLKKTDVIDSLESSDSDKPLSARQGLALKKLIDNILGLLSSDDSMLDTVQEIVSYIKNNKSLIDSVSTNKVDKSDIVDNLGSGGGARDKPLSSNMGEHLYSLIQGIWEQLERIYTTNGSEFTVIGLDGKHLVALESRANRPSTTISIGNTGGSGMIYNGIIIGFDNDTYALDPNTGGYNSVYDSIILGRENISHKGACLILGNENKAMGTSSIAIGHQNTSNSGISIGLWNYASPGSVRIGNNGTEEPVDGLAESCYWVAIGGGASVYNKDETIEENYKNNTETSHILAGIAIGSFAQVNSGAGVAIGADAYAEKDSIAIGKKSRAEGSNVFVVLGNTILMKDDSGKIIIPAEILNVVDALDSDSVSPLSANQGRILKNLIDNLFPIDDLSSTVTTSPLSANQGRVLKEKIDAVLRLLASDDSMLDTVQEIVDYIKSNKSLIDSVSTNKINKDDIIDNLISNISDKPLSAAQGYALKLLIDGIPAWAKAEKKPTYTPAEVGAEPAFDKKSAFNKDFGDTSGTVCAGDDPRLSDSRPASDVPDYIKSITAEDINTWNNPPQSGGVSSYSELSDKPSINGQTLEGDVSLESLGISASFGLSEGMPIQTAYFNTKISIEKMTEFLSALTPTISTGRTGSDEIAVIFESSWYQGIYSIDLSKFGGSGYALALCNASFAEDGVTPIFTVLNVIFVSEYSETNQMIIQNFLSDFTYGAAGWQDISSFEFTASEIYSIVPNNPELKNKVSAFIGTDTKLWDILSMMN